MRNFDIEMTLWLIGWIQRRNHRAYLSHRKNMSEQLAEQVKLRCWDKW